MHLKYQRRSITHAERDLVSKRQTSILPLVLSTMFIHTEVTSIQTVTTQETVFQDVTEVVFASGTTSSLSSTASITSASVALPKSTTSARSNSTQPSQTSMSSSTLKISPTVGTDRNSNVTVPPSSPKVPGGTVAAIFMGCLLVVTLAVFYMMRSRFKSNGMKRRPLWVRRTTDSPLGISSDSYESKPPSYFEPEHSQYTPPPPMPPLSRCTYPTMPPDAYNKETVVVNLDAITANPNLITTPRAVYVLGPNGKRSAFEATVTSTFLTTYSDELAVDVGESLRVVAEYDDGWNLCMNKRGEHGMVPVECLDSGKQELQEGVNTPVASLDSTVSSQKSTGSERSSSLRP